MPRTVRHGRPDARPRPRHRRRRTRGTRRRRLRRLRGTGRPRIETQAPGGQAGSSSKIENYLGFPTGISGQELAARATHQAQKFGATMMVAHSVRRLDCSRKPYRIVLDNGETLSARAIVIATGAQYNKPRLPNLRALRERRDLLRRHLHRVAAVRERRDGRGRRRKLRRARRPSSSRKRPPESTCSSARPGCQQHVALSDPADRGEPEHHVHYPTEIVALEGGDRLERVTWQDQATGETGRRHRSATSSS